MDRDAIADMIAAENVRRYLGRILLDPAPGTLAWRVACEVSRAYYCTTGAD